MDAPALKFVPKVPGALKLPPPPSEAAAHVWTCTLTCKRRVGDPPGIRSHARAWRRAVMYMKSYALILCYLTKRRFICGD